MLRYLCNFTKSYVLIYDSNIVGLDAVIFDLLGAILIDLFIYYLLFIILFYLLIID